MFAHIHELQFEAKPDGPDPAFARRLQEVLGGQWGEMTVAIQYLYQGWNCRLPGKYKDMLMAIGTEELAHVEMIATMIDRLLDVSPADPQGGRRRHGHHGCLLRLQPAAPDRQRRRPTHVTATVCRGRAPTSRPAATCWPTSA